MNNILNIITDAHKAYKKAEKVSEENNVIIAAQINEGIKIASKNGHYAYTYVHKGELPVRVIDAFMAKHYDVSEYTDCNALEEGEKAYIFKWAKYACTKPIPASCKYLLTEMS